MKCKLCGSLLEDKGKMFRCSESGQYKDGSWTGCGFQIMKYQKPIDLEMDEEEMEIFLEVEQIIGDNGNTIFLDINNPPFYTKVEWKNKGTGSSNHGEPDENGIVDIGKGYKKDGVVIWKESYGRKFSKDEAIELLDGNILEFDDFVNKKGEKYTSKIKLESDKLKLIFDN